MVRGESLTSVHGAEASEDLVKLMEHFPVLHHVGEKMPFERLESDLKVSWDELMRKMRERRPGVREDLVWKAWRTIRGEYFRDRCPKRWKGNLKYLGNAEIPNRQSTRSNYDHGQAALRRYQAKRREDADFDDSTSSLSHIVGSPRRTQPRRPARRVQKRAVFSPEPVSRQQSTQLVHSEPRLQTPVQKRPRISYPTELDSQLHTAKDEIEIIEHIRPNILQETPQNQLVAMETYRPYRHRGSLLDPYIQEVVEQPIYMEQASPKPDLAFRACLFETWRKIQHKRFSESFLSTMKKRCLKLIDNLHD